MANINKRMKQNIEKGKMLSADQLTALEEEKRVANRKYWTRYIIMMFVYAAVYDGITYLTRSFAFDMHQFRIAEVMVAIVFFDPAAFPGMTIGCIVANFFGPGGIPDAILGGCATAFGIYCMKWWAERNGKPYVGMALYALFNAFMVALELSYNELLASEHFMLEIFAWVMLGEVVCSVVGGTVLHFIISRRWKDIVSETKKGEEPEFTPTTLQ